MSANIKQAYPLRLIDIALTVINNIEAASDSGTARRGIRSQTERLTTTPAVNTRNVTIYTKNSTARVKAKRNFQIKQECWIRLIIIHSIFSTC